MERSIKNNKTNDQYILQTVETTLNVLDLFFKKNSLSIQDVTELLGINRTVAFRHLHTLTSKGYLYKGKNDKYYLSLKLYSLGRRSVTNQKNQSFITECLKQLRDEVNETIHLVSWDSSIKVILLDEFVPNQLLRYTNPNQEPRLAHNTSTGIALLSTMTDEQISDYIKETTFEHRTGQSIKDEAQLIEIIRETRQCGYAINRERYEDGIISFAMPIPDSSGPAQFAVSISGPAARIQNNMEASIKSLKKCIEMIVDQY